MSIGVGVEYLVCKGVSILETILSWRKDGAAALAGSSLYCRELELLKGKGYFSFEFVVSVWWV